MKGVKPKPAWLEISDEEEVRIQKGIAQDPDNPEWSEDDFKRAKPFAEVFPDFAEEMRKRRHAGRLPDQRGLRNRRKNS
jgi:hypothetical protein